MSDTIGRIAVPTVTNSAQSFPLTTHDTFSVSVERAVAESRAARVLGAVFSADLLHSENKGT
jgi:hypothetical protein